MVKKIYGSMPAEPPEGYGRRVNFPVMARMNTVTGDHRRLDAEGGFSRDNMPHTIRMQERAAYGHEGAMAVGGLFEATFDTETNIVSGQGYMLADDAGERAAMMIKTGVLAKNSVDLADVKARFVEDMSSGDYWIDFTKWGLAATTFVATPAFGDAHGEIVAALADDEELVASFAETTFRIQGDFEVEEMIADGSTKVAFEDFYMPEARKPQKIIVTEDGRVYGHVALWNSCHGGIEGQCLRPPRPSDGYASFNKPGVLTDRGIVGTGPIFALGGHRPLKGKVTAAEEAAAYGGIENAWCDVRVTEGVFGPWVSGRVRPGVKDEVIYAARASRISGHWKGASLRAIVSVNAEGFDVPGDDDLVASFVSGFGFTVHDGEITELVASFPGCIDGEKAPDVPMAPLDDASLKAALERLGFIATVTSSTNATLTFNVAEAKKGPTAEALMMALLLEDEDDEEALV